MTLSLQAQKNKTLSVAAILYSLGTKIDTKGVGSIGSKQKLFKNR
jgi:hypothetical protein